MKEGAIAVIGGIALTIFCLGYIVGDKHKIAEHYTTITRDTCTGVTHGHVSHYIIQGGDTTMNWDDSVDYLHP